MARLPECRVWPPPTSPSPSLAVRAFQLSVAAAQNLPAIDYWDYLEHIEAPQWVDLTLEASLEGTQGDDPWFYQHHPHHETPLEELVFGASRDFNLDEGFDSALDEDFGTSTAKATTTSSSDQSLSLESSFESGELKKHENGRLWPGKAKRIQLRPACEIRNDDCKVTNCEKTEKDSDSNPSGSFSTKLLATLMARLRANEGVSNSNSKDSSLSESKLANRMKNLDVSGAAGRIRSSAAGLPLSDAKIISSGSSSSSKPRRDENSKNNKENSRTPTRVLNLTKKPKLMTARKSLANFDFGKNSFSVGRNDGVLTPQRRRLSCKSPRLKAAKSSRFSHERRGANILRISPGGAAKELPRSSKEDGGVCCKSRYGVAGDDLAALVAKHNLLKPKYEPRLHSTRDIREWERKTGQQYYSLQPIERVKVNQDITEFKRAKVM